ncbi:MAG: hypothetical protein Q8O75_00410 [bacterium]|nr:hypothetical protein [bacterium]
MLKTFSRAAAMVIMVTAAILTSPTIIQKPQNLAAYQERASVAIGEKYNESPNQIVVQVIGKKDDRASRLSKFLASQGSPLQSEAANLVVIADRYDLDWRFLPAITGVESTYGQAVPAGSYNPYGWGNGSAYFKDWSNASDYVAGQIRSRWGNLGKITPWKVGPGYAANPHWAARVNFYMTLIGNYQ